MFTKDRVKIGIAPIGWTNDDLPELGAENSFEQTISEMATPKPKRIWSAGKMDACSATPCASIATSRSRRSRVGMQIPFAAPAGRAMQLRQKATPSAA